MSNTLSSARRIRVGQPGELEVRVSEGLLGKQQRARLPVTVRNASLTGVGVEVDPSLDATKTLSRVQLNSTVKARFLVGREWVEIPARVVWCRITSEGKVRAGLQLQLSVAGGQVRRNYFGWIARPLMDESQT